jgi:hypothetical protein
LTGRIAEPDCAGDAETGGSFLVEANENSMVDVTIPVEPEAAAVLADPRHREAMGRLVSRVLHPHAGPRPLARAIVDLKAEARAAGLTDADIDAELAAYNAERRERGPAG